MVAALASSGLYTDSSQSLWKVELKDLFGLHQNKVLNLMLSFIIIYTTVFHDLFEVPWNNSFNQTSAEVESQQMQKEQVPFVQPLLCGISTPLLG